MYGFKYSLFGIRNINYKMFMSKMTQYQGKKILCKIYASIFEKPVWFMPDDDSQYYENSINICKTNSEDWKEHTLNAQTQGDKYGGGVEEATDKNSMKNQIDTRIHIKVFKLLSEFKITWPEFELEFYSYDADKLPVTQVNGKIDPNFINDNKKYISLEFFTQISMVEVLKNIDKRDINNYKNQLGFEGKVAAKLAH